MILDFSVLSLYNLLVEGYGFFVARSLSASYHKIVPDFGNGSKAVRPSTSRRDRGLIIYNRKQTGRLDKTGDPLEMSMLKRSINNG